jgi:tRNA(fMet)-specific endonuclease VapC
VLGELYSGAARSARPAKNLGQIQTLLEGVIVLTVDEETARHFGEISSRLAEAGSLIPQNDMWIAACAMQWGLTLASADAHFSRIEGLKHELWC